MDSAELTSFSTSDRLTWLRNNLPVIVQPECDIKAGFALVGVFVRSEGNKIHLRIIYEGEGSYDRRPKRKEILNSFGTLIYRSFNYFTYRRTADIDQLCFENVDFNGVKENAWKSLSTTDYNGEQSWNRGLKKDFCFCYSFTYHYNLEAEYSKWGKYGDTSRPILYLNTCNHLHGPEDKNPDLSKKFWLDYPVWEGDSQAAELYARNICVHKKNLFSCFRESWCCCCQKLRPESITEDENTFKKLKVFI
jgi:hypothetical protein